MLDPYERKTLKLIRQKGPVKFGEIIMRLALSANHGHRIISNLKKKELVMQEQGRGFKTVEDH